MTPKLTHPGIHAGKVKGSGLNNGSASHCNQPVDKSCKMIRRFTISSLKDRVQDRCHFLSSMTNLSWACQPWETTQNICELKHYAYRAFQKEVKI